MFIGSVVEILLLAGFYRDGKTWKSLTMKTDMEKSWNRKNCKKKSWNFVISFVTNVAPEFYQFFSDIKKFTSTLVMEN